MPRRYDAVAAILKQGIEAHAFPAAAIEIGRRDEPIWNAAFGALTFDPLAPPATPQTLFDLASLTKVIATTTLVMQAVDDGRLALDDAVGRWLARWRGADRDGVTVRHLLAHSSGLPAYLPLYRECTGRAEYEQAICATALEGLPNQRASYSDLGFILLGFILEAAATAGMRGTRDPARGLAAQFDQVAASIGASPLRFTPPRTWRGRSAPTREFDDERGRPIVGEVDDENCWALYGVAGHAGLFGSAAAVGTFARAQLRTIGGEPVLAAPRTAQAFIARQTVPASSRALGWDTMLPTSSCGALLSPSAIGHTGFTGTSLWIDWERDLYIALLTNRVYPAGDNQAIRDIRPRVHDAVVAAISR